MSAIENVMSFIERQKPPLKVALGVGLLVVVGIGDYLTGFEVVFSLFYVLPIAFMTWFVGRWAGIAMSVVSAIIWLLTDLASGISYTHLFIPLWNTLIRLVIFLVLTVLMATVRTMLQREKDLARIDYLTGAANSRQFYELLNTEIERSKRHKHSLTLAYIDLDNFKSVNDQFGHPTGDLVLATVVSFMRNHLRKIDTVARLGGDEFAILLPKTGMAEAQLILAKLRSGLLDEMQQQHWPITFSIGAVICGDTNYLAEELLKIADNLMYTTKRDRKDAIKYMYCTDAGCKAS